MRLRQMRARRAALACGAQAGAKSLRRLALTTLSLLCRRSCPSAIHMPLALYHGGSSRIYAAYSDEPHGLFRRDM